MNRRRSGLPSVIAGPLVSSIPTQPSGHRRNRVKKYRSQISYDVLRENQGMAKESDTELLKAALFGYQVQSERLEATIADIKAQLGHRGPGRRPKVATNGSEQPAPKKRTMSASARKRIALAQKKRWATYHEQQSEPTKPAKRKKRKMSAEGKARIAEATKARWEAYRKAKAKAQR
jgi:hypothetical protein